MSSFLKSRIKSFGHGFSGIRAFIIQEKNGRIHAIAAILITIAGFIFNINMLEWCIQTLCIALVIGFEMLNSSIEKTVDIQVQEFNPKAKYIKDVAAGAVLVAALLSLVIASIIYLPKFANFYL